MIRILYGNPNIHKERHPLIPLVDYMGSMAYNLSRSLADLLKPLVGKTECFVKNTASFIKDIKNITIEPEEIMNSHNVVSVFTNIPIKTGNNQKETGRGQDPPQAYKAPTG